MKKFSALKKVVLTFNILLALAIFAFAVDFFVFPQKPGPAERLNTPDDDTEYDASSARPAQHNKHSGISISYTQPAAQITSATAAPKQESVDISQYITVVGTCVDYSSPDNSFAFLQLKKKNNESLAVKTKEPIEFTGLPVVYAANIQVDFVEFSVGDKTQKLQIGGETKADVIAGQAASSTPSNPKAGIPDQSQRPRQSPPVRQTGPTAPQPPVDPGKIGPPTGVNIESFNTYQDPQDPYTYHVDPNEYDYITKNQDRIGQEIEAYPQNLGPDGDSCDGALIKKVAPGSILEKRGLKSGDIIKKINGIPIKSVSQKNTLMNDPTIRNAAAITVEVERAGQTITLQYKKQ